MPRLSAASAARNQPFKKFAKIDKTKKPAPSPLLDRFTSVLRQTIAARFADTAFTRDDLLMLVSSLRLRSDSPWAGTAYGLNDTTTGTRYRKVCGAVQTLIASKDLVALDWVRLCLPSIRAKLDQEPALHVAYLPTVRSLVQQFPPSTPVDVMSVVDLWTSDQHLPENVKRMTVRGILPALLHEGLLRRQDDHRLRTVALTAKRNQAKRGASSKRDQR